MLTWQPSFPDLTGWTQQPHNGTITPGAGEVGVAFAGFQDASWDAATKLPVILRYPLASMGMALPTYLVFKAAVSHPGGYAGAVIAAGLGLWEADTDVYRCANNKGNQQVTQSQGIANSFGTGIGHFTGLPCLLRIDWNNSPSPVVTDAGIAMAAGDIYFSGSGDGGSSWVAADMAGYGDLLPHPCAIAPTELALYGYRVLYAGWEAVGLDALISDVVVEAPLLSSQYITSVTGPDGSSRVSSVGGEQLAVVGQFAAGFPMTAHLGLAGDATDAPCYFGQGLGYTGASADGLTVEIIAPPLPATDSAILTIVVDGDTLNFGPIEVVERNWPSVVFNARRNFPPWSAVGRRRLELEELE